MRRRTPPRSILKRILIVAGLSAAVYIAVTVIAFWNGRDRLPIGTRFAEVDVGGLVVSDAISKTNRALQAPVFLNYQGKNITLSPVEIDFRLDEQAAKAQLEDVVAEHRSLDKLPALLLREAVTPPQIASFPSYSSQKLEAYLNQLAQNHDQRPQMAVPDLATQQVASARAGFALNVPEARQMILNALNSTEQRTVNLPIDEIAQGSVSVKSLANAVQQQLAAFTQVEGNVAGVFIKDLTTGEELTVNDDVAFSAQGWLKLALLVEVFRLTAEPTPPEVLTQLEAVALQGNNGMANSLLTTLGLGDPQTGVNQLNDTLRQLGLLSTFLAQPFGQDGLAANFVTPANSRENVPQTNPDPNAQATLAQVAALLEFVEQCRNGVGPLPLVFVGAFSPAKCTQILDLLTRNRINALIEAGSPGASVAHRQNWDANNHGDAALVRSAGRTYIIVVMLHSQQPLDWPNSSVVIANIARLTYALFNNQVPPAAAGIGTPPAP